MLLAFPMSLTGAACRWLRNKPSGSITTWEGLKVKFLSKYCPPARTAKKIEEINNFQQETDETLYQAWERFKELWMKMPLTLINGYARAIQEMAKYSQKWHNRTSETRSTKTSDGLVAIQAQLNNLRREIKKVNKKERGFGSLPSSTKTNPRNHVKSILTADMTPIHCIGSTRYAVSDLQNCKLYSMPSQMTIPFPSHLNDYCCDKKKGSYELQYLDAYLNRVTLLNDSLLQKEKDPGSFTLPYRTVKYPKGIAENVLVGIGKFVFPVDFIILDMPKDINVPLILGRPFLSTAHVKVDVFKRKITLKVGDEKIVFKPRLMGETLILNRSFDPLYGDYIELNDLNEPLELRRNKVDDLEPTVKEGEVVNEPMMDIVKTRCDCIGGLDYYPSNCDFDRKILIGCAYNLKFSCMMGFELVHVNFLLIFPINVMSKKFYNSIMKDKIKFKGRNELGNFVNAPVFIGNFYVITNFKVMEDIDPYLDEGMGYVIVGEPFCKASCVEARRFDGIITIRDGDDSVTYQMVRSNPSFKHLTNEKCNKIPPLLKDLAGKKSTTLMEYQFYSNEDASNHICRKNTENLNNKIIKLNEELSDCETNLYNYKRGLSQVEARLVEFKNNEIKFCERIRVLERDLELRDNKIENLKNELEEVKKEKESIDFKIEKFDNASKDLDCLLGTQRSIKDKKGLGLNEYTAVPPPPAQVYSHPKNDLSWTGLPEFVDDTVTDYSRPTPSIDVPRDVSESVSFFEQRGLVGNVLSKPMISFVKETGCPSVSKVNNTEKSRKPTVNYAEMYRS
ncbi:homeodomain-like protein [Tanacetum coccineum]